MRAMEEDEGGFYTLPLQDACNMALSASINVTSAGQLIDVSIMFLMFILWAFNNVPTVAVDVIH